LFEPWETLKSDGSQYKVFTPFFKNSYMGSKQPRLPLAKPEKIELVNDLNSDSLEQLELLPKINWASKLAANLQSGEKAGQLRLNQFLDSGIGSYKIGRDFPSQASVSRLSPYLHFGEISPNQAWYAAKMKTEDGNSERFCSELGWREFSYSLLYHFPELPDKNWQAKFDNFPWRYDKELLEKWQKGQTGFPIIDAGMRELWQTGYMHNRVRMIVASFLVKNLLIDWRYGAKWFWDCLFDADLAANSASWQWVAGCGADAAPYFRIFNPITQGEKFDSQGQSTRSFVPELAKLPDKYLFAPWQASDEILSRAGVILGKNYPKPIVDLKESRERALQSLSATGNLQTLLLN
ncbi:MAG: deoxyribodipyrimidine photo-lyase, partial [Pseudomonadota bacterium]